jgi:cyclopropane fatty-acyl-phospholipid synthase-like methyltransferase
MTGGLAERFYIEPAAAYVRGSQAELDAGTDELTLNAGLEAGLRLHRFKRARVLLRVRKILGLLRGMAPTELLDIGTGRGAFLWPLLEAYPTLPVTCVDQNPERVRQLDAVARGGIERLTALEMDVTSLALGEESFDVITALEVLEHIPDVQAAVRSLVRVGRRFALVSVPSRADDNPEHVHLLSADRLKQLFREAGAERVDVDAILGHLIVVVKLR